MDKSKFFFTAHNRLNSYPPARMRNTIFSAAQHECSYFDGFSVLNLRRVHALSACTTNAQHT